MMGVRDEDTVSSLAGRLARLNTQLDDAEQNRIKDAAGGLLLSDIVRDLVQAIDPDRIEEEAKTAASGVEPTEHQRHQARAKLVGQAANIFNGPLINLLDGIRREKEQTIDHDNIDTLLSADWSGDAKVNAEAMVKDFASYLEEYSDQVEALTIFYSQPARRSEITYAMIKTVLDALKTDRPKLAPLRVWRAYALLDEYKGSAPANDLTTLVALIRRACGIDAKLAPFGETVRRNFQSWILKRHSGAGEKFTEAQMDWLRMIRDHTFVRCRPYWPSSKVFKCGAEPFFHTKTNSCLER
jgi:type I restriction enzyme R subunit